MAEEMQFLVQIHVRRFHLFVFWNRAGTSIFSYCLLNTIIHYAKVYLKTDPPFHESLNAAEHERPRLKYQHGGSRFGLWRRSDGSGVPPEARFAECSAARTRRSGLGRY